VVKQEKIKTKYHEIYAFWCTKFSIGELRNIIALAGQFCVATAPPNNPVDHESQNLILMTLFIFLIEGLY
jgi:hypothetical protein